MLKKAEIDFGPSLLSTCKTQLAQDNLTFSMVAIKKKKRKLIEHSEKDSRRINMEKKSKTLQHVMNAHEEIVLQGRRKLKISVYPLLSYKLPFMDHSLVVAKRLV